MATASVGSIDTESIITQLMAVERNPQDLMKTQISTMQTKQNAWQAIADKLTALQTASDALGGLGALAKLRTVTSTDPTSVSVSSTGAGASTNATIDVVALASAQSVLVSDVFNATTDPDGGRSLQLTDAGGTVRSYSSADGTIGGLANAINAAGIGVSARLLQTSPGKYQLALTATTSGTANAFTAAGTGFGTFTTVRPAADAQIQVDGVLVKRSTNIIGDVIDGVQLTLLKPTGTAPVTITSARDTSSIVAKVKAIVDAANAVGTMAAAATKIGTDASTSGPLAGDYSASTYMDTIRNAIAQPLSSATGKIMTASALGISLNKDGTITFTASALQATLDSMPDDAIAALGQSAASTADGVTVASTVTGAKPGIHAIVVTQAALQPTLTGAAVALPAPGTAESLTVTGTNGTSTVTFNTGASWAETVANVNIGLKNAGVAMTASVQTSGGVDQGINLTETRYGTQTTTIAGGGDIGLTGATTGGSNAAGTMDGVAFVANGRTFVSGGLVVSIATNATQIATAGGSVTGNVSFTQGLAGALSAIGAQGGTTGPPLASKATLQTQIDQMTQRVSDFDHYLSQYESTIRAKFTSMQTMLSQLQSMQATVTRMGATTSTG